MDQPQGSHVYILGFCSMTCWWYLIIFVLFVVCQWCLYHDNQCLTVLFRLSWIWMLINDDAIVWWYVFDSVIYDWFKWYVTDKWSICDSVIDDSVFSILRYVCKSYIEEMCIYTSLIQYSRAQNLIFVTSSWVLH